MPDRADPDERPRADWPDMPQADPDFASANPTPPPPVPAPPGPAADAGSGVHPSQPDHRHDADPG
jgi:hypothetical protein